MIFSLSRKQVWTFSVLNVRIYEMRYLFVAVGSNARFIVLGPLMGGWVGGGGPMSHVDFKKRPCHMSLRKNPCH